MSKKTWLFACLLPISSACMALTAEQQQAKLQQTERQVVQLQRTVKQAQASMTEMKQDTQQLTERQQAQQQAQQQQHQAQQQQHQAQQRQLQALAEQTDALLAQQQQHSGQLQAQATQQAQLGQSLQQLDQQTTQTTQALDQTLQHRSWWYAIATGLIALLLIIGYVYLNRRGQASTKSLTTQLEQTISQVRSAEEKATQADTALADRLFEILTQLKIQQQNLSAAQPTAVASGATSVAAAPDHHLPLKLADEIHRMRKRLATLPEETKGLTPLKKSLERLENELLEQGYEIVDHQGMAYTEDLSANARFIPSDELAPDQQLISKVVSPQVNYQGVLIRMADIEVSIG